LSSVGYELLLAFFLMVLLPLVIAGFIASWMMTHEERQTLEQTWEGWALKRSREYVPAYGEWPNRTSPNVRWQGDDFSFSLSARGKEGGARTRLVAWPRGRLLGDFTVVSRTSAAASTRRSSIDVEIEDEFFASAFVVTAERPSGIAGRVLDDDARRALLGFWQRDDVRLLYRHGRLTLEWPGRESNQARLDEAERVLCELARRVDVAFLAVAGSKRPVTNGYDDDVRQQ
jgi:hypothetical protein